MLAAMASETPAARPRLSRVALTSLVNGLAGLVVLPLGCSTAAILFGLWGRRRVARKPGLRGRGVATAGLVLGVLGLALAAVVVIADGWDWTTVG
jgi:hypothetical protein